MSEPCSIEFAQLPIVVGMAGHNFIALRSSGGHLLAEMHGLATGADGRIKPIGWLRSDRLLVYERPLAFFDRPGIVRCPVFSGTAEQASALWARARMAMHLLNERNGPYPVLGFNLFSAAENSNAAASTLMAAMGLAEPSLSRRLIPGARRLLLTEAELGEIGARCPLIDATGVARS